MGSDAETMHTFRAFKVLPLKATGARIVGGMPAWLPVVVTVVLLVRRKLKRACTLAPSTRTTDSGRLSMFTSRERWLGGSYGM